MSNEQITWKPNPGYCPVGAKERVEIYLKNGERHIDQANYFFWGIREVYSDILYYRETANLTLDDAYDKPPKPFAKLAQSMKETFTPESLKRPESKYTVSQQFVALERQIADIYKIAFGEEVDVKVVSRVLQIHYDKQRWTI